MAYLRPAGLDEALAYLAEGPAQVLAGGTDVFPALGARPAPRRVLDLTAVAALRGIAQDGAGWRIGAGVTWAEVLAADLPAEFDGLKVAARQVGSVQIQTTGTIAGNLCNASPAADGVPVLLALDAAVEIASHGGCRTLPVSEFVTGPRRIALAPGEIVTAIRVPAAAGAGWSGFAKLGARTYLVISIASLAMVLRFAAGRVTAARVAVGACSAVPMRLPALEAALAGRARGDLAGAVAPEHFAGLSPIDDVRATAAYRRAAVEVLARRMLGEVR